MSIGGLNNEWDVGIALEVGGGDMWVRNDIAGSAKILFGDGGGTAPTAGDFAAFYDVGGVKTGGTGFYVAEELTKGAGDGAGDSIHLLGQDGGAATGATAAGVGGDVLFVSGDGGAAGTGSGASAAGGDVRIEPGAGGAADATNPVAGSAGGAFLFTGGTGGAAAAASGATGGAGGAGTFLGGTGGAAANTAGATAGTGGAISIDGGTGGAGTATVAGGTGGNVAIDAGSGGPTGGAGAGSPGTISIGGTNTTAIALSTASSESTAVISLTSTTDAASMYVGTSDPSAGGGIAGNEGSLFMRGTATAGQLWLKTGAADTAWTQIATGTGSGTLQTAYDNGASITTDASGPITFNLAADAQGLSVQGGSAGAGIVDFGGTTTIDSFNVDAAGALTFDGGAASNFTTSAGDITIDAAAASVNIDGGEADAAAISIQASNAAGGIDIDAGTAGIDIASTGDIATTAPASSATAWVLDDGTTAALTLDSTDQQLELGLFLDTGSNVGVGTSYTNNSGSAITVGKLVAIEATTALQIIEADATGASADNLTARAIGVTMEEIANAASGKVHNAHGTRVNISFSDAPAAADIGKVAYVGTAGQAVKAAPSTSGDFVTEVGIILGAESGGLTPVLFAPNFVASVA
jgi:hypothetical protein